MSQEQMLKLAGLVTDRRLKRELTLARETECGADDLMAESIELWQWRCTDDFGKRRVMRYLLTEKDAQGEKLGSEAAKNLVTLIYY